VTTFWDKVIPSAERTALNYIIQSTCAENVLRQMIKISNYLKGSKSYVAFPIHDSIVLDLSVEDKERLPELLNIFSNTELGKFKVNVSVGTNFGNLKKLEV
jgi:DNA polymerase I-like protein with 3'-5' exonuclease and polymerase domains